MTTPFYKGSILRQPAITSTKTTNFGPDAIERILERESGGVDSYDSYIDELNERNPFP